MKISEVLKKESVEVGLDIESKDLLLKKMVDMAALSGNILDNEEAKLEIFKREKIMSTGVGKGIALPHAKTNSIKTSVGSFAVLKSPIDFDSLDDQPVDLVFLILGKENNVGNHLRLLSKISNLMNNESFRSKLRQCKSAEEIIEVFSESDNSD